jgi:hypothetical protein
MMSAMMCFVPLLVFLSHSFATQTSTAPPAPIVDSLCLSEVLISTPQPYDPAQIAAAQRKADSAREAIRQRAKFEDIEDRVFAMKVGDVSDVIRTKQGFLVLQVTECGRHGGSGSIEIPKAHQYGLGLGTIGRTVEGVEILSNTPGVELIPYLRIVVRNINRNWHGQIPASETRKGKLAIEFAIMKDGNLAAMWLVSRPGGPDDEALVRMAWASITKSNPFPPLPSEFTGSFLALRFRFDYSQR